MERRLAFALVALAALVPSPARAEGDDEPREPVSVTVTAPQGCTSEASFVKEVFARTQRARVVDANEAERRFDVVLDAQRGAFRGTLTIEAKDGSKRQRVLMGRGCTALASALALVTALTIDPQASTRPAAELLPAPPPPPAPEPRLPPPDAVPEPPEALATEPMRVPIAVAPPLPLRPGSRFDVGAFVSGGLVHGVVPDLAASFGAGVLVANPRGLRSEVRLALGAILSDTTSASSGQVQWSSVLASLDACPVRIGERFSLLPCLVASGGWVGATASGLPDPQTETRGAFSVGAAAHGRFREGPLFAEAGLALGASIVRARYYVDPNVDIFRTPWLSLALSLRIGGILPWQD